MKKNKKRDHTHKKHKKRQQYAAVNPLQQRMYIINSIKPAMQTAQRAAVRVRERDQGNRKLQVCQGQAFTNTE